MTEFERKLLDLLDDIEILTTDEAIIAITQTRFDIAEEQGYEVTFDSEPVKIH